MSIHLVILYYIVILVSLCNFCSKKNKEYTMKIQLNIAFETYGLRAIHSFNKLQTSERVKLN